jgi:hypothetical protein
LTAPTSADPGGYARRPQGIMYLSSEGGVMCFERLTDKFEEAESRTIETTDEQDLERPEMWPEPTEEPETDGEREKEYAHA